MREKRTTIGIDPDKEKSGVAILNIDLQLYTLSFPDLVELLKEQYTNDPGIKVVIEAGWLVQKSCFHAAQGKGAEKIAKDVGANHQVGRLIAEMCEHIGIDVECVPPLRKRWSGPDGKITHAELSRFKGISLPKRTNQEQRDAALIAIHHSGMPIIYKP